MRDNIFTHKTAASIIVRRNWADRDVIHVHLTAESKSLIDDWRGELTGEIAH